MLEPPIKFVQLPATIVFQVKKKSLLMDDFQYLPPSFLSHLSTYLHQVWQESVLLHGEQTVESDLWNVKNQVTTAKKTENRSISRPHCHVFARCDKQIF